ncbi:penicillin-binding protein [Mycolicibacterium novocastrense]|uniref:Penicillin-binding protein n=1 Tax=Mycolicibacterium novocastrense TaxID=59813 RepID=A0AAW5SNK4_MYCNV|nr:penicillin-binding protein [Mycolicibacterium novocastrense]GAT08916.1 bifunctional penicillin-binding protein 1A/1B ponA1: penicillin-insensitive transglycosylase + penicillin-sensitive transpeptidase [Mycolicibacterium novocastrense]
MSAPKPNAGDAGRHRPAPEAPQHRSAPDAPQQRPPAGQSQHRPSADSRTRPVPPDDRHTSVLPPVREARPPHLRDPVDVVKAALDGTPTRKPPTPPPPPPRPPGGGGPPSGPSGPRRGLPSQVNWTWVRRGALIAAAVFIVLPLITFGMAYMIVDVPKPGDIRTNQVSTILASDGSELAKIVPPEGNRVDVNIDQIPVQARNAVMAAEDRDFYSNPGFSFTGFARAIKNNLFGGDLQGGSTITQQYVKNALVGSERSGVGGLIRKAKELVISTKMSGEWSKDQVMQSYLNIIYFGRGSYGIAAASKAYFNKPVEELNVAEGALLAALIQRPSALDPAVNLEGATARWNWVLDGMVEIGALTPEERAAQVFPATVPPDLARSQNQTTGPNGLIERQVQKELLELFDINEQTLNTEGLQITTTIDPKAQQAAEEAAAEYLEGQDPDMRTAIVSIDPRTGGVKAYYGGTDANGFDFAQAGLPTGSSFKVFALVAALQQGMGLGTQVDSSPLEVNGIKITNVEGGGCGTCNIAEALKRSLNTSYYRLMLKLKNGPQDVADAAHQAGIAESFPGVEHTLSEDGQGGPPNNGIVLGQYQSRVIDMASAYATLAASGVYHKPHFVQKVVNSEGEVLFDASQQDNSGEQRIEKKVADNVTSAMQPIAAYSNGHALAGGRPSAAKTGTNQLGDTDSNRDAWMVGYTPSLSTAVWVGTTEGTKPLENQWGSPIYGSGLPSDIWKATMDGALEDTDNESFPKPEEIGGYAGVPQAPPPPSTTAPPTEVTSPSQTVIQPTIEVAPGITIPWGPPTTVPVAPPPGGTVPGGPVPAPGVPAPAPAPFGAPPPAPVGAPPAPGAPLPPP